MTASFDRQAAVAALQRGLPLTQRPYAALAARSDGDETSLLAATQALIDDGSVSRFGLVVRHRALGYVHNAMVVWDVADDVVDRVGETMAAHDFVTLCYRRPRRPPLWPYNLFCMIHGRERATVLRQVARLVETDGLAGTPHELLFSRRCFKQRGARYASAPAATGVTTTPLMACA